MKTIQEAYEAYDQAIDETGDVSIFGMTYLASRVLKKIDPIAYNVGFNDFLDLIGVDIDQLDQ